MSFEASIFKAYDISGVVPSSMDKSVVEGLGKALARIRGQERAEKVTYE